MPIGGEVRIGGLSGVAVSRDGQTLAGTALDGQGRENAAIWQGGRDWRLLGSFSPDAASCDRSFSSAYDVSDDGRVVVGLGWNGCRLAHAFRWEEATGMVDLGSTVSERASRANGISGDGRVVVGWQEHSTGFRQGARWIDGRQEIYGGPQGFVGEAHAANRDGSVVVGQLCNPETETTTAWTWTPQAGLQCHRYERRVMNHPYITMMLATSDDGRVIGGASSFGLESESLVWFDGEVLLLRDYLRQNGIPDAFEGWVNTGFVTGVSPDGRTLVGYGAGRRTFTGFIVLLPELGPRPSAAEQR
jgi:probable HAF family extracellular repeat protein